MEIVSKLAAAVCIAGLMTGCGSAAKTDSNGATSPTATQPSPSPTVSDLDVRAAIKAGLSARAISAPLLRKVLAEQLPAASPAQVTRVLATMHVDWNEHALLAAKKTMRGTTGTTQWLLQHALVSTEKFTRAQATYAIGHLDVDWNAQAVMGFQHILDTGKGWSRSRLIRHVVAVDHYSRGLARYAADNAKVDWKRQAVRAARASSAYGRAGVLRTLARVGFTAEEAAFAAEALGCVNHIKVNWNVQALRSARSYLKLQPFSRDGLIDHLSSAYGGQFTYAQAVYAANHVGL